MRIWPASSRAWSAACFALAFIPRPVRAAEPRPSLSPADGAREVCPDTPLRLTFPSPPSVGRSGKITITDEAGSIVDEIDLAQKAQTNEVGGVTYFYHPVLAAGTTAEIFPHAHALAYGASYRVRIDAQALWVGGRPSPAPLSWAFSTRAKGPPPAAAVRTVDPGGGGDFCTVQGAVDSIPDNNERPRVIAVRKGTYPEMVHLRQGKNAITLRGEDRRGTVITYPNNAAFNASSSRALMSVDADGFVLENLTLRNTTPKGGSQAEALRVHGDRCILRNAEFSSFQDTLMLNGRVYVTDCLVEGDVDFVWGTGAVLFHRCELRALNRGYLVQSRNPPTRRGYAFVECRLTAAPGVSGFILARIEAERFPESQVAFIDCSMGPHVAAAGWVVTDATPSSRVRFWEYASTDLSGRALDVSRRHPLSRQLTGAEASGLRDPATFFDGWNPEAN